jgi:hypothetical protein
MKTEAVVLPALHQKRYLSRFFVRTLEKTLAFVSHLSALPNIGKKASFRLPKRWNDKTSFQLFGGPVAFYEWLSGYFLLPYSEHILSYLQL